ncbi:MAG: flavin reductase [Propionibacterium sp.]|nr:flavin reductase [Propionibacterium sp.]
MPEQAGVSAGTAMRGAFRAYATGVAIATAVVEGRRVGVLVSSLVSVSVSPPVVSVSLSDASFAAQEVLVADRIAVHMLTGADRGLADWFARPRPVADEPEWVDTVAGEARLATHGPVLSGSVADRVRAGSATVMFVTVDRVDEPLDDDPLALVHVDRHWHLVARQVTEE